MVDSSNGVNDDVMDNASSSDAGVRGSSSDSIDEYTVDVRTMMSGIVKYSDVVNSVSVGAAGDA